MACWDLIGKAHFTFPKPGLIHLGAPADRSLLLSAQFPRFCFPSLFIFRKKMNKNCAEGVQGRRQRKCLFSPSIFVSLGFLFKVMFFTENTKRNPRFFPMWVVHMLLLLEKKADQSNYDIAAIWWNSRTEPAPTSIHLPAVSPPLGVIRCARPSLESGRFK